MGDREGFLEKAGVEETWRGVVIFTADSRLEWADEAKAVLSSGAVKAALGGESDENRKGVADRGCCSGQDGAGRGSR